MSRLQNTDQKLTAILLLVAVPYTQKGRDTMYDQYGRYIPDYGLNRQPMQRHEIIKVNGRGGAEAFQMAPNSTVLLLDANEPVLWVKSTDGAGYPTCTAYKIEPYQPVPEVTNADLLQRIMKLEEIVNGKSDTADVGEHAPGKQSGGKSRRSAEDAQWTGTGSAF